MSEQLRVVFYSIWTDDEEYSVSDYDDATAILINLLGSMKKEMRINVKKIEQVIYVPERKKGEK